MVLHVRRGAGEIASRAVACETRRDQPRSPELTRAHPRSAPVACKVVLLKERLFVRTVLRPLPPAKQRGRERSDAVNRRSAQSPHLAAPRRISAAPQLHLELARLPHLPASRRISAASPPRLRRRRLARLRCCRRASAASARPSCSRSICAWATAASSSGAAAAPPLPSLPPPPPPVAGVDLWTPRPARRASTAAKARAPTSSHQTRLIRCRLGRSSGAVAASVQIRRHGSRGDKLSVAAEDHKAAAAELAEARQLRLALNVPVHHRRWQPKLLAKRLGRAEATRARLHAEHEEADAVAVAAAVRPGSHGLGARAAPASPAVVHVDHRRPARLGGDGVGARQGVERGSVRPSRQGRVGSDRPEGDVGR